MIVLPIIGRELRAEARRPATFWLRVVAAGLVTAVAALSFLPNLGNAPSGMPSGISVAALAPGLFGARLFGNLNAALFLALWVLVPMLTADCINREKREGTLGLLFLTPLTSAGIVIGKGLAQALRASTLYLATLPVIVMPLMFGGVTWKDGVMAALVNLGVLLLGLAAGLLASAWTRDWLKSVALAQLLAAFFILGLLTAHRATVSDALTAAAPPATPGAGMFKRAGLVGAMPFLGTSGHGNSSLVSHFQQLFSLATNLQVEDGLYRINAAGALTLQPVSVWSEIWSRGAAVHRAWFQGTAWVVLACLVVLLLAVFVAGKSIERAWRDEPASVRRQQVGATLTRPVIGRSWLRRRLRRALERNPIGWLHQYSSLARLTKWGWCAFVVLIEIVLSSNWQDVTRAQGWVVLLVLLGLAFSAASSFRLERETGALELLLVTPLRAGQILRGRLQGIRQQYLPALLTLLLAWACLLPPGWLREALTLGNGDRGSLGWICLFASAIISFITLPAIGLYFSLQRMNQLVGWLCACVVGLLIPWLLFRHFSLVDALLGLMGLSADLIRPNRSLSLEGLTLAFLWQFAAALVAVVLLHRNLARRRFVLN